MNKYLTIILGVLLVVSAALTLVQYYKNYKTGDVKIREELLIEVMWEISEDESINKSDIRNIEVLKFGSGVPPMNYSVAVNFNNGDQILYSWKDKNKSTLMTEQ